MDERQRDILHEQLDYLLLHFAECADEARWKCDDCIRLTLVQDLLLQAFERVDFQRSQWNRSARRAGA